MPQPAICRLQAPHAHARLILDLTMHLLLPADTHCEHTCSSRPEPGPKCGRLVAAAAEYWQRPRAPGWVAPGRPGTRRFTRTRQARLGAWRALRGCAQTSGYTKQPRHAAYTTDHACLELTMGAATAAPDDTKGGPPTWRSSRRLRRSRSGAAGGAGRPEPCAPTAAPARPLHLR